MSGRAETRGLPRAAEVIVAGTALVVASPALLLIALLIKTTSNGPAIFRQTRVGRLGKHFTLYKFRTMRVRADGGPQVTARGDGRVTPLGRLLRKSKLDELPELWNILTGDMSFVGPRPEVPRYVSANDPAWRRILDARPGLTDPVTLRLRNEEELLAGVEGDREEYYLRVLQPYKLKGYAEYEQRRTCLTDVSVLLRTAVAVILPYTAEVPTPSDISSHL